MLTALRSLSCSKQCGYNAGLDPGLFEGSGSSGSGGGGGRGLSSHNC